MLNIFKSEFYKLVISKAFRFCMFISAALGIFFAIALNMGVTGRGMEDLAALAETLSAVTMLEQTIALGFLPTLFALFVSLFVAGEFQHGTMKNYVSKGFGRIQIYLSKVVVCGVAVLVMLLIHILFSLLAGTIIWGFDPYGVVTASNLITMFLSQCLLWFAFSSVFTFVSIWLRNTGMAIAVNVGTVFLFSTILMALNYIIGDIILLSDFWILEHISTLASLTPEKGVVTRGIITGACYFVVASVSGCILFKKQDIK